MTDHRIAFVSGAGGTGKTTTAIAVAAISAERYGGCTLIDTNTGKNTGAATWWLDRIEAEDRPETLAWAQARPSELAAAVKTLKGRVVVDTPPGFVEDEQPETIKAPLRAILDGVSAAVVLGAVLEFREIDEAIATIRAHVDTPLAVAFTRTATATDESAFGAAARQLFASRDVPVLGSVRQSTPLQRTKVDGVLPSAVRAPTVRADLDGLVDRLDKWLTEVDA